MAGPRRKNSNNVRTSQASPASKSMSRPVIEYISTFVVVALLLAMVLAMAESGLSGNRVARTAAPAFAGNPGATVHVSSSSSASSSALGISPLIFALPPWCGASAPTYSSTTAETTVLSTTIPQTSILACRYQIQTNCDPGCQLTNLNNQPGVANCGIYTTIQCTCASGYKFAQWWTAYSGPGVAGDCSWSTNPLGDKLGSTDYLVCNDNNDFITASCSCIPSAPPPPPPPIIKLTTTITKLTTTIRKSPPPTVKSDCPPEC